MITDLPLEVRDLEAREIYGRIVPYGEEILIRGRRESFARGALADIKAADIRLLAYHDQGRPIGRAVELEEREDGAYALFKVSKTDLGNEMLELANDGVLTFSPGFLPGVQDRNGVHRRVKALPETSLVTFGAYSQAQVLAVREEYPIVPDNETTPNVETETRSEVADLEIRVGEIQTSLDRIESVVNTPAPRIAHLRGPRPLDWFRAHLDALAGRMEKRDKLEAAYAEFQTRAANGELETRLLEDVTGSFPEAIPAVDISGVVIEEFIGAQLVNVLDTRRRLFAHLGSFPMPRSGYAKIPVITQHTEVGVRTGQKDPANSRSMIITTAPFEAVWYDGAVDIALEVIRMAEVGVVEMVWNDLLGQYAIATEAGLVAGIEAGVTGFDYTGTALDTADYEGLATDLATQAIAVEAGSGSPAEFVAVTDAQWIAILSMVDGFGRRLLSTSGPSNADGSANLTSGSVNLAGLDIFRVPGLTQAFISNTSSLRVADGGPERVQALNVELMGHDLGILGRTMFVPRIPAGVVVFGTDPAS